MFWKDQQDPHPPGAQQLHQHLQDKPCSLTELSSPRANPKFPSSFPVTPGIAFSWLLRRRGLPAQLALPSTATTVGMFLLSFPPFPVFSIIFSALNSTVIQEREQLLPSCSCSSAGIVAPVLLQQKDRNPRFPEIPIPCNPQFPAESEGKILQNPFTCRSDGPEDKVPILTVLLDIQRSCPLPNPMLIT